MVGVSTLPAFGLQTHSIQLLLHSLAQVLVALQPLFTLQPIFTLQPLTQRLLRILSIVRKAAIWPDRLWDVTVS